MRTVIGTLAVCLARSLTVNAEQNNGPDEQTMQPTKLGLKLTPRLARAVSSYWVQMFLGDELVLRPDQKKRITEAVTDKIMGHPASYGTKGTRFAEYVLETEFAYEPSFTPETGQDYAERVLPLIPMGREMFDDLSGKIRPLLDPNQQKKLDAWLRRNQRELNLFEAKLKRWADGGAQEKGEHPFRWTESDRAAASDPQDGRSNEMRWAENDAEGMLESIGPTSWRVFLSHTEDFFAFTDQQSAQANRLLADYSAQAKPIMTDEWKRRIRKLVIQQYFSWLLMRDKQPNEPWVYQLNRQLREATKPLKELGRAFRQEVLAMVTEEQRKAALAKAQAFATEHGLPLEFIDTVEARLVELARNQEVNNEP